jgi:hypothetical protein
MCVRAGISIACLSRASGSTYVGELSQQAEDAIGRRSTRPIVDNVGDVTRINFLWTVAWLRTIAVRRDCGGGVINPRSMAVLIRERAANQLKDRTPDVSEIRIAGQRVEIVFIDSNKPFGYGRDRVRILRDPKRHALTEGERVEVDGNIWESATEVLTFTNTDGAWSRIFYRTQAGENYRTYLASQVRVITSATETPAVAGVLRYWRHDPARCSCSPTTTGYPKRYGGSPSRAGSWKPTRSPRKAALAHDPSRPARSRATWSDALRRQASAAGHAPRRCSPSRPWNKRSTNSGP